MYVAPATSSVARLPNELTEVIVRGLSVFAAVLGHDERWRTEPLPGREAHIASTPAG